MWKLDDRAKREIQTEIKRTRQTITRVKENKGEQWGRERKTVVKRRERV